MDEPKPQIRVRNSGRFPEEVKVMQEGDDTVHTVIVNPGVVKIQQGFEIVEAPDCVKEIVVKNPVERTAPESEEKPAADFGGPQVDPAVNEPLLSESAATLVPTIEDKLVDRSPVEKSSEVVGKNKKG